MKLLIIGENSLIKLSSFNKSIFSNFSFISSIYARQLAAVTPKKYDTTVLDSYEDIDFNEECDVVHIHFKTSTALKTYEIADEYRKRGRNVILSGNHPSALPEEAKQHADSIIIGSAEYLWPFVLKDLEGGKLKPFYKSKGDIIQKSFQSTPIGLPPKNIIGIIEATRGCPYQCDFCQESNIMHGSIFRTRSLDDVIREIKSLPQKLFFFCDVSMTIDVNYTKSLFKLMKGLKKKFVCEGNADALAKDEEIIKLSAEAGCIEWTVGFESFFQQTLESIHKKTNVIDDYARVVNNVHKYKMAILGNFMFGFDTDTPEVFELTKKHIIKLGLDSARFAILTPYPGTPLFKKFDKEERILTYDWSKYNRKNVVFKPKNISKEELENGFKKISADFNSLPNMISRDIKTIRLGFYPFLANVGRNLESYMNRPR